MRFNNANSLSFLIKVSAQEVLFSVGTLLPLTPLKRLQAANQLGWVPDQVHTRPLVFTRINWAERKSYARTILDKISFRFIPCILGQSAVDQSLSLQKPLGK
jgi:hypothetical protein